MEMVTKTITVTEEAYDFLSSLKSEQESFSHLLVRLGKEKSVAEKYFGILRGDVQEAQKRLQNIRKRTSEDIDRRHDVLFGHQRSS